MTESIRTEFLSMLKDNDWMDETSKNKAIQKVFINQHFKIIFMIKLRCYFQS